MKNRVWETMTTIWVKATGARVRVWRTVDGHCMGPDLKAHSILRWLTLNLWDMDKKQQKLVRDDESLSLKLMQELEDALGDNLAAVEYVNSDGDGVVLYPDWR
jgi:hypothetical protein